MVKAIWQAAKELAIPAVIAAGLTIFVMDRSPQPEGGWSIFLLATTFFGVLGSAAFVTNQIFSARNQKATDRSLNSIIDRLQGMLDELDVKRRTSLATSPAAKAVPSSWACLTTRRGLLRRTWRC